MAGCSSFQTKPGFKIASLAQGAIDFCSTLLLTFDSQWVNWVVQLYLLGQRSVSRTKTLFLGVHVMAAPKQLTDLIDSTAILPYVSELFGIYQPLLAWLITQDGCYRPIGKPVHSC
jgi:hypothetical protein